MNARRRIFWAHLLVCAAPMSVAPVQSQMATNASGHAKAHGPYRAVPPWGTHVNGTPAHVMGYPPFYGPPVRASYATSYYVSYGFSVYWSQGLGGPPLRETIRRIDPNSALQVTSPKPAMVGSLDVRIMQERGDLGAESLKQRAYARAAAVYMRLMLEREQEERVSSDVTTQHDRTAMRLYALSLVGEGRFSEAARAMLDAYTQDPSLPLNALEVESLLSSPSEMRRFVVLAVGHARSVPSYENWMLVARLMEMDGRDRAALKIIERAEAFLKPVTGTARSQ